MKTLTEQTAEILDYFVVGIPEYEDYFITNCGRVFSTKRSLIELKPAKNLSGYTFVVLCKKGEKKNYTLHRLVAENFVLGRASGLQVNHIDGNKTNNNFANLEWVTAKENTKHAIKAGLMKKQKKCKKIDMFNLLGGFLRSFGGAVLAEQWTGICRQNIGRCALGKCKTAGGYIFKFSNNQ